MFVGCLVVIAEKDLTTLIESLIDEATEKPSSQFGDLVYEIDHKRLGLLAKNMRKSKCIKAVDVARQLGISKVQLHFLEIGRKQWNIEVLRNYLRAIYSQNSQRKKGKKQG